MNLCHSRISGYIIDKTILPILIRVKNDKQRNIYLIVKIKG